MTLPFLLSFIRLKLLSVLFITCRVSANALKACGPFSPFPTLNTPMISAKTFITQLCLASFVSSNYRIKHVRCKSLHMWGTSVFNDLILLSLLFSPLHAGQTTHLDPWAKWFILRIPTSH